MQIEDIGSNNSRGPRFERLEPRLMLDAAVEWSIVGASTVNEGEYASYTVSYTGTLAADATVDVDTGPGTDGSVPDATEWHDYKPVNQTLTFLAGGDTSQTFEVAVASETTDEGDEDFSVTLSNTSTGTIATGQVNTIIHNAPPFEAEVYITGDRMVTEGGLAHYRVYVREPIPPTLDVATAGVIVSGGTATSGVDFQEPYVPPMQFNMGTEFFEFTVQTVADSLHEGLETFDLELIIEFGVIAKGKITTTIVDPDVIAVAIGDHTVTEGDPFVYPVELSAPHTEDVSIPWTATFINETGGRSIPTSGTFVIPAGQTTASDQFATVLTAADEGDDVWRIALGQPTGGVVVADRYGTMTIFDEGQLIHSQMVDDVLAVEGLWSPGVTIHLANPLPDGDPLTLDYWFPGAACIGDTMRQVTFHPGEQVKWADLPVDDNGIPDPHWQHPIFLVDPAGVMNPLPEGMVTIIDNDGPAPALTVSGGTVSEDAGSIQFTVSIGAEYITPVTIQYATADHTAQAGSDYVAALDSLVFDGGETVKTIDIALIDDSVFESSESFFLEVYSLDDPYLGDARATGTIDDNDELTVSINDVTVTETAGNAVFTVSLSASSSFDTTVDYSTSDGTAAAGLDYTATSGTLTISAGDTTATITVPVLDDLVYEGSRTFSVDLSNPTGATIADNQGVGMIVDNDPLTLWLDPGQDVTLRVTDGDSEAAELIDNTTQQQLATWEVADPVAVIIEGSTGDETLTVAFANGDPIEATGVAFNAGGQSGDTLILAGGSFTDAAYAFTDDHDGSVDLDGSIITYTGLAPITSTITATNVALNYGVTSETITVTNAGSGQTTVDSTAGESVTFDNPSGMLTIRGGDGDDTVNMTSLATNYAEIVIDGEGGADTMNVNGAVVLASGNGLSITADTINVNQSINTNGGDVTLTATGEIGISGSTVSCGLLSATSSGGGLTIDSGTTVTAAGNLVGEGATGITIEDCTVSSDSLVSLSSSGGGITLSDTLIYMTTADVDIVAAGDIALNAMAIWCMSFSATSSGGGLTITDQGWMFLPAIQANGSLSADVAGDIVLTNARIVSLFDISLTSSAGGLTLTDTTYVIEPHIRANGSMSANVAGDIALTNTRIVSLSDISLTSSAGGLTLTDTISMSLPHIQADGSVSVDVAGDLTVLAGGEIRAGSSMSLTSTAAGVSLDGLCQASSDMVVDGATGINIGVCTVTSVSSGASFYSGGGITLSGTTMSAVGDVEIEASGDVGIGNSFVSCGSLLATSEYGGVTINNGTTVEASGSFLPVQIEGATGINIEGATVTSLSSYILLSSSAGIVLSGTIMAGAFVDIYADGEISVNSTEVSGSSFLAMSEGGGLTITDWSTVAAAGNVQVDVAGGGIVLTDSIVSAGGRATMTAFAGDLRLASGEITAGGDIWASAPGEMAVLAGSEITSTGGSVWLTSEDIELAGAVAAPTGTVAFNSMIPYGGIHLGADLAAGVYTLTDTELDRVTATGIDVGLISGGDVTFTGPVSPANAPALAIFSYRVISEANTSDPDFEGTQLTLRGDVSPGESPGILSVTGDFAFADDSTFTVELGGTSPGYGAGFHDQLSVTGEVTIGVDVALTASPVGGFEPANQFVIIDNDGTDAVVGEFAGLPEGTLIPDFLGPDVDAHITYVGGDGNDVVLTVPNRPPTADADGPYAVSEGGSVALDASGSSDLDQPDASLIYEWDFDGDGQYDDATGVAPTFSAIGLDGPSSVTVGLRVTDDEGETDTDTAEMIVTNVAPTPSIAGVTTALEGDPVSLTGSATDPAGANDTITLDWTVLKNGAPFASGSGPDITFTPDDNATYEVTLTASDEDGGSE
ncbi:MAG: Calx-beta domain-containing protein, partial [Planctomycetota bacterium]